MSDMSVPEEDAPTRAEAASSPRGFALPEPIAHREGLFGAGTDSSTSGFAGLVTDSFLPGEATRPYGSWFDQVVDVLEELISADGLDVAEVIEKVTVDRGQLAIFIAREHIARVTSRASPPICATTRTCASRCAWAPTAPTTRRTRGANCTPSTPCTRSRTTA